MYKQTIAFTVACVRTCGWGVVIKSNHPRTHLQACDAHVRGRFDRQGDVQQLHHSQHQRRQVSRWQQRPARWCVRCGGRRRSMTHHMRTCQDQVMPWQGWMMPWKGHNLKKSQLDATFITIKHVEGNKINRRLTDSRGTSSADARHSAAQRRGSWHQLILLAWAGGPAAAAAAKAATSRRTSNKPPTGMAATSQMDGAWLTRRGSAPLCAEPAGCTPAP